MHAARIWFYVNNTSSPRHIDHRLGSRRYVLKSMFELFINDPDVLFAAVVRVFLDNNLGHTCWSHDTPRLLLVAINIREFFSFGDFFRGNDFMCACRVLNYGITYNLCVTFYWSWKIIKRFTFLKRKSKKIDQKLRIFFVCNKVCKQIAN